VKLTKPNNGSPNGSSSATLYRPLAFASLSDQELVSVYSSPIRKYAKGETIVDTAGPCSSSFVILSGTARISWSAKDCDTLAELERGEWFGRIGGNEALPFTVSAIEASTVMNLSATTVKNLPARVQSAIHEALLGSTLKAFRTINQQARRTGHSLREIVGFQTRTAARAAAATATFISRYLAEIPKLPPYANNLAIKLLDERTTPQEVADGIKQDPALAALVLQRVNSSYYALSSKVTDYYRACLLLGLNNIYHLVLNEAINAIMPGTEAFRSIQEHSFIVSLIAHDLAQLSGKVPPQFAATAGLLHDIGKGAVWIFKRRHQDFAGAFDLVDDSRVGAALLQNWELPEGIVQVIEHQNLPAYLPPEQLPEQQRHAIGVLYLAHLCSELLCRQTEQPTPQTFISEYLSDLGFRHAGPTDLFKEKVYPELMKTQKRLPKSIRTLLSDLQH
jgi:putative nucleotidyltransferase with HDIG domain